jgi:hypothetical protein
MADQLIAELIEKIDPYVGNGMPESIAGPRWEQCRIKVNGIQQDCPGCKRCMPNNGYVLRNGSWRPTKSHEYIFMFAKTGGYYINNEAVQECGLGDDDSEHNMRSVLTIPTVGVKDAHYAVMTYQVADMLVKTGVNTAGCCANCGRPHVQVKGTASYKPSCNCVNAGTVPFVVLDLFSGAGTTGLAALRNSADYYGIDVNSDYHTIAEKRFAEELGLLEVNMPKNKKQMSIFDLLGE